jgi:hypothetical protein
VRFPLTALPVAPLAFTLAGGLRGPIIRVAHGDGMSFIDDVYRSYAATVEHAECSNHGLCDYGSGLCRCFPGYTSSNGFGQAGRLGDCGHVLSLFSSFTSPANVTVTTSCPFRDGALCAGHGYCDEDAHVCRCAEGYDGLDCSRLACGLAYSWFGLVGAGHSQRSLCAGVGSCSVSTGTCQDCGVFAGDRCEHLACPRGVNSSLACSGSGTCMSLRQLAQYAYTDRKELAHFVYDAPWDAERVYGCACARAVSVDGQYDIYFNQPSGNATEEVPDTFLYDVALNLTSDGRLASRAYVSDAYLASFYRGPYAFAVTDYTGHACGQMRCPQGDDPRTAGVLEVQSLLCYASAADMAAGAWFRLQFRENASMPIAASSSLASLQARLQAMYTLGSVRLWAVSSLGAAQGLGLDPATQAAEAQLYADATVCSPSANATVFIEFLTELGALPLLREHQSFSPHGSLSLQLRRVQAGTREEVECSAMGLCDASRGRCRCVAGYQSSNGSLEAAGQRGDCSFFNKYYTTVDAV